MSLISFKRIEIDINPWVKLLYQRFFWKKSWSLRTLLEPCFCCNSTNSCQKTTNARLFTSASFCFELNLVRFISMSLKSDFGIKVWSLIMNSTPKSSLSAVSVSLKIYSKLKVNNFITSASLRSLFDRIKSRWCEALSREALWSFQNDRFAW